jgi:hypothetical protein
MSMDELLRAVGSGAVLLRPASQQGRSKSAPLQRARRLVLSAILMVAGGLIATSAAPAPAKRPNILYIMADDLGYADIGCYGQTKIRTPNIDRLAQQSTRFTDVYAGAPVCAPSRCVLMTGLHTGHCRIRANAPRVGGEIEEFGEGWPRLSLTNEDRTIAGGAARGGLRHGRDRQMGTRRTEHAGHP